MTGEHGTDGEYYFLPKHVFQKAGLLDQLRWNLDTRGTLDVLRNGIELFPVKSKIALAQYRPASGINTAINTLYAANRLRVVRQVRYSAGNKNCLDLVFFLNGLPVATVELIGHQPEREGSNGPVPL